MKRIFQHPPAPTSGRRYWRSTDELADTPEFREWLEREFPSSAAQLNGDEWSRRSFLKLMGASVALAGFGVTSCRRPEMHLVPFTKTVEWTIQESSPTTTPPCRGRTERFRFLVRPSIARQLNSTAIRRLPPATVTAMVS